MAWKLRLRPPQRLTGQRFPIYDPDRRVAAAGHNPIPPAVVLEVGVGPAAPFGFEALLGDMSGQSVEAVRIESLSLDHVLVRHVRHRLREAPRGGSDDLLDALHQTRHLIWTRSAPKKLRLCVTIRVTTETDRTGRLRTSA
jgi:hypothetical protein